MKQKNKPDAEPHVPVIVKHEIELSEADAFWLIENSDPIRISPQQMASRMLADIIHDDRLAHMEEFQVILH